jgi:diadenosine tetraphosphate (Ap4A) HIT family hydrolase
MAWPLDFDARFASEGCPMCRPERAQETEHGIRVLAGRYADAYLCRRGPSGATWWSSGHRGHVAEPTDLSAEEAAGYFAEVLAVSDAVRRHFGARKVNDETLGTTAPHLHTHVTARYAEGDVNPGAPLPKDRDVTLEETRLRADAAALGRLLRPEGR